jgi:hypothetical protein
MAFASEMHLQRLEESIAAYSRALAQPLIVPLRIVDTDASGISTMKLLQEDLPFGSPSFYKTKVFDHPNVLSATFLTWPTPHFVIVGTVDGVLSAMRRRYSYFIQQNAIALFKQESADSLIFRPPRPLSDNQLHLSIRDVPDLEPVPPMTYTQPMTSTPPSRYDILLSTIRKNTWDSDFDSEPNYGHLDVNFRPYDPTIDPPRLRPFTTTSMDDDPPSTLPFVQDETDSEDDLDDHTTPIDLVPHTPPLPPIPPTQTEETPGPSQPTCPPNPQQTGNQNFFKIKNIFLNFFK